MGAYSSKFMSLIKNKQNNISNSSFHGVNLMEESEKVK